MIDGVDGCGRQIEDSVGRIDGQPTKTEQWREHEPKNVHELSLEFDRQ